MYTFPLDQFIPFAIVVCVGIFTQAATGFAAGLVIVPLMLWAGHGIPEAQAAMMTATIPQNVLGVIQFRDTINKKELALPALLRFAAFPIGVATLYFVEDLPVGRVRQLVGAIVIGCVALLILFRPAARQRVPVGWTWLAFTTSGFFAGLTGTGGPMMVLWVQAHDWSTRKTRSFLFTMYLLSIPPVIGLLYFTFGDRIVRAILSATLLIPIVLVVAQLGLRLGTRLGRDRLRQVTMVLLVVIGVVGLFAPVIGRSFR